MVSFRQARPRRIILRQLAPWAFLCTLISSPLLALPVDSTQNLPPAERHYRTGLQHLQAGQLDDAERQFNQSLQTAPGMASATLGLAEVAAKRGDIQGAERLIREAVKAHPDHPHAQSSLGRLLFQKGDHAGAEKALLEALRLAPSVAGNHIALGDLYMNGFRDASRAVKAYQDAVDKDPRHGGAHYALGVALAEQGHSLPARAALSEAHRLEPGMPLPLIALARLLGAEGDHAAALQEADRALALAPQFPPALMERGKQLASLQRWDEAAQTFRACLTLDAKNADAAFLLGATLQSKGDLNGARQAYLQAIQHNPRLALAYNNLAWLSAEQRTDLDKAMSWASKAVELVPGEPAFRSTLGWVQRARGNLKEAAKTLQGAVDNPQASADTYYRLGIVRMELGETALARSALQRALELQPSFAGATDAYARLKTLSGS